MQDDIPLYFYLRDYFFKEIIVDYSVLEVTRRFIISFMDIFTAPHDTQTYTLPRTYIAYRTTFKELLAGYRNK